MRLTVPACLTVAALSLGAVSAARAQGTTTCHEFNGTVTCNTMPDPMAQLQQQQRDMNEQMRQQQSDMNEQMAQARQRRAAGAAQSYSWKDVPATPCTGYQKAFPDNHAYCGARDVATARKAVGDLIAAGRCDDALKGALGTGDLDFARDVRAYFAAK